MEKEKEDQKDCGPKKRKWHKHRHGMTGGAYFLAFIGAAVYYIQQAESFWPGVLGLLKAIVWPAFLIYEAFVRLSM